jgi:hypothetical protein
VPRLPLVQATSALIAETPRSRAAVPVGVKCQEKPGPAALAKASEVAAERARAAARTARFGTAPNLTPRRGPGNRQATSRISRGGEEAVETVNGRSSGSPITQLTTASKSPLLTTSRTKRPPSGRSRRGPV